VDTSPTCKLTDDQLGQLLLAAVDAGRADIPPTDPQTAAQIRAQVRQRWLAERQQHRAGLREHIPAIVAPLILALICLAALTGCTQTPALPDTTSAAAGAPWAAAPTVRQERLPRPGRRPEHQPGGRP
jgi:hypothetical protein